MAIYNITVTRVSCKNVFCLVFCIGTFLGGIGGILLGMAEQTIGFWGGSFLGLLVGIFLGVNAILAAIVFNAVAPIIGGLAIQVNTIKEASAEESSIAENDETIENVAN